MIKDKLKILKKNFKEFNIDGYVIPKNDEFFSEYSRIDRLKIISNFSGSAGYAVVLKGKNYLFVDGRYTLQAEIESANNFKIIQLKKIINCNLFKNLTLGVDPKLFTTTQLKNFFLKYNKIKPININLIDKISKKRKFSFKPFYSINKNIIGENHKDKIYKVIKFLIKNNANYIFISAPENVAWLLNIRGYDSPNSPIPNCHLLLNDKQEVFLIANKKKVVNLIKDKKINSNQIIEPKDFKTLINSIKNKKIIIDQKTCSLFYENILRKNFTILKKEDPIYLLKSIKNKTEIQHMINSHIIDGVALTKFIYWIKNINKKKITEYYAQNKLERFRRRNKKYLFPSFNTIAGSGPNGAIVHYRATKKNKKIINKNDIFLCDSGGQYEYGTTDVTRTICFSKPKKKIKDIFTRVLKGHISVATTNLNNFNRGKSIDPRARKYLKEIKLDYEHGTGHGVGFFLNVHEGPQSISKYNQVKLREGMIVSNEPGYYKKGEFGIRIENLLYVRNKRKKITFENLTLAPIDKDLIDFEQLSKSEKNYLFKYNLLIYEKLSKFLSKKEKRWLASFI